MVDELSVFDAALEPPHTHTNQSSAETNVIANDLAGLEILEGASIRVVEADIVDVDPSAEPVAETSKSDKPSDRSSEENSEQERRSVEDAPDLNVRFMFPNDIIFGRLLKEIEMDEFYRSKRVLNFLDRVPKKVRGNYLALLMTYLTPSDRSHALNAIRDIPIEDAHAQSVITKEKRASAKGKLAEATKKGA